MEFNIITHKSVHVSCWNNKPSTVHSVQQGLRTLQVVQLSPHLPVCKIYNYTKNINYAGTLCLTACMMLMWRVSIICTEFL